MVVVSVTPRFNLLTLPLQHPVLVSFSHRIAASSWQFLSLHCFFPASEIPSVQRDMLLRCRPGQHQSISPWQLNSGGVSYSVFKSPAVALETPRSHHHLLRESCQLLAVLTTALTLLGLRKTLISSRSTTLLQIGSVLEQCPSAADGRWFWLYHI